MVTCYHVKKQMTENKVKEQKEYLYGTALQRVGDGEIPAGKYKGNGFVRCKANQKREKVRNHSFGYPRKVLQDRKDWKK